METFELLLALAASARADGGREVLSTLRTIVVELAPFDAGEVLLRHEGRLERWSLVPGGAPLAGEDLLLRTRTGALRVDEIAEAEGLPATRERLRAQGLRSLLALPLAGASGGEGVLVLARRHGWAFVGASLPRLGPVAVAIGLALRTALSLTALRRRVEALAARVQALEATGGAAARERDALARDLADARSEQAAGREAAVDASLESLRGDRDREHARAVGLEGELDETRHRAPRRTPPPRAAARRRARRRASPRR